MLDLDELADRRARKLNQPETAWREAVWSPEFQKISASMSDGEVEELLALCPSASHLKGVVKYLEAHAASSGVAPFTLLNEEAARAGVAPAKWIEGIES